MNGITSGPFDTTEPSLSQGWRRAQRAIMAETADKVLDGVG